LLATAEARTIGFDETRKRSEAEFFARCAIAGIHGFALHQPLVFSEWTIKSSKNMLAGYGDYAHGEKEMAGCCGGNSGEAVQAAKKLGLLMAALPAQMPIEETVSSGPGVVRLEFVGPQRGAQSFGGPGRTPSGRSYLGGNNTFDKYKDVDPRDVDWLEGTLLWKRVKLQTPTPPPPSLPPQIESGDLLDRIVQQVKA
jgi:hypothetical protein